MNFWERSLTQTAVYWGAPIVDGWGAYTFAAPVEISVRWVDKSELFIAGNSKQQVSSAIVLLNQDVDEQGYLFLGNLDDLDSDVEDSPALGTDTYQIKKVQKVPDFRGKSFLYKAWL